MAPAHHEGRGFNPDEVPNAVAEENMTAVVFHAPGNRLTMSMVRHPIHNVPPRGRRSR